MEVVVTVAAGTVGGEGREGGGAWVVEMAAVQVVVETV